MHILKKYYQLKLLLEKIETKLYENFNRKNFKIIKK